MSKIKQEPVLAWLFAHVVVNGTQIEISGIPTWIHLVILILSTISAGAGARHQVTPNVKVETENPIYGPGSGH